MLSKKFITQQDDICKPQLTSLIDVMTILLVFLLKSFSVESQIITPAKDISLPISKSKTKPTNLLSFNITKSHIIFEDKIIANINEKDSLLIEKIYNFAKNNINPKDLKKKIIIQIDKNNKFSVQKNFMKALNKLGATQFSILVIEED